MFVIQPNTIIRYTLFHTSSYFCPFRNLALYNVLIGNSHLSPPPPPKKKKKKKKKRAYTHDIVR